MYYIYYVVDSFCLEICYVTVSTYDASMISLIINYSDTSAFCMHGLHDTTYDTTTVASLNLTALHINPAHTDESMATDLLGLRSKIEPRNVEAFKLTLPTCRPNN